MEPPDEPIYQPFAITVTRDVDEAAVVPVGEIDLASAEELAQEVGALRAVNSARIVLDLRRVSFIDSTGLRLLISLRNDAKRNRHAFVLIPPSPAVGRIFDFTGTRGLFDWATSHEAQPA